MTDSVDPIPGQREPPDVPGTTASGNPTDPPSSASVREIASLLNRLVLASYSQGAQEYIGTPRKEWVVDEDIDGYEEAIMAKVRSFAREAAPSPRAEGSIMYSDYWACAACGAVLYSPTTGRADGVPCWRCSNQPLTIGESHPTHWKPVEDLQGLRYNALACAKRGEAALTSAEDRPMTDERKPSGSTGCVPTSRPETTRAEAERLLEATSLRRCAAPDFCPLYPIEERSNRCLILALAALLAGREAAPAARADPEYLAGYIEGLLEETDWMTKEQLVASLRMGWKRALKAAQPLAAPVAEGGAGTLTDRLDDIRAIAGFALTDGSDAIEDAALRVLISLDHPDTLPAPPASGERTER